MNQRGAHFKVLIDTARSVEIPTNERKTDVEKIAIPKAPRNEQIGIRPGTENDLFTIHKNIALERTSGNAATSVLRVNMDCVAGG